MTASPAGAPTLQIPTVNESYYSQPPSASTPRFRSTPLAPPPPVNYGSLGVNFTPDSLHKRQRSVTSMGHHPLPPASPAKSVYRTLRKTASAVGLSLGRPALYDEADDVDEDEIEAMEEDEAQQVNGTRVWYRCVFHETNPVRFSSDK